MGKRVKGMPNAWAHGRDMGTDSQPSFAIGGSQAKGVSDNLPSPIYNERGSKTG